MAELSAEQKAVSLIFPGFKVGLDDPRQAELLAQMGVGGFCLYAGSVDEISFLTRTLQAKAPRPLLFCADYEDGLAQHCAGGTALVSNMGLGAAGSEELAFEKGALTGLEARAIGVPWVFAPVCDLATYPGNPIVNVRSFSSDPGEVVRLARAYLRGLKSQKALSCLKHFPGHGETRKDSHLDLPAVDVARAVLSRRELAPFRDLAADADAVMTGHLLVPALEPDAKVPYSLSADVARTLRGELRFSGLVSTDALNMRAISDRFEERDAARRALLGGSDILLVPVDARDLSRTLSAAVAQDAALGAAIDAAYGRLERARRAAGLYEAAPRPDASVVGCAKHLDAARRMAERCLAWPRGPIPPLPARVRYFEPEAEVPSEWLGEAFVEELRASGVEIVPFDGKPGLDPVVVGCFLAPHAYTGQIEYDDAQQRRVQAALSASTRPILVSFGSPFVFDVFSVPGLCAFSRIDVSQSAAARALRGAIPVTGRLPVRLGP